jgi:predicted aspartyl protease
MLKGASMFGKRDSTALILFLLATAACGVGVPASVTVPADSVAGEAPFRLAGPGGAMLLVSVEVNGQGPYDLVLDTGATLTCLDRTVASELQLPRAMGAIGYGAGVGSAGPLRLVRVDSLRLGAAHAERMMACVLDLQHLQQLRTLTGGAVEVHGLLGLNFLKNFRVTLDFERNVVSLH